MRDQRGGWGGDWAERIGVAVVMRFCHGGTIRGSRGASSARRPLTILPRHVPSPPEKRRFSPPENRNSMMHRYRSPTCGGCATHTSARPFVSPAGAIASATTRRAVHRPARPLLSAITQVVGRSGFDPRSSGRDAARRMGGCESTVSRRRPGRHENADCRPARSSSISEIEVLGAGRASCRCRCSASSSIRRTYASLPLPRPAPRSPARQRLKRGDLVRSCRPHARGRLLLRMSIRRSWPASRRKRARLPSCRSRLHPGKSMRCRSAASVQQLTMIAGFRPLFQKKSKVDHHTRAGGEKPPTEPPRSSRLRKPVDWTIKRPDKPDHKT